MLKRYIGLILATVFFAFQIFVSSAAAKGLDKESRTILLNDQGEKITISLKEARRGKKLFGDICAQCHPSGRTKTNPNVTLSPKDLAGAIPRRDSIEGLVDYMKEVTAYDGESDWFLAELHPAKSSSDLFPEMRNLTDDDLAAIAGYILTQINVKESWGKGKAYE